MIENEIRELLQALHQQMRKKYANEFRNMNIHVGQESALCILWQKDGITQTELRRQMKCEASTLSNMLKKLERDEIVYRQQSKDDARSTNVFLTQKGKDLREPIEAVWKEQQAELLKGILPEELLFMRRLLKQMIANIENE